MEENLEILLRLRKYEYDTCNPSEWDIIRKTIMKTVIAFGIDYDYFLQRYVEEFEK